ncbi:MAG: EAL domain-containing protein [Lysobacteraceae bacterium]|nr:MAG: EAL domain-containing protein [Xanthomonadaceae bacterium]
MASMSDTHSGRTAPGVLRNALSKPVVGYALLTLVAVATIAIVFQMQHRVQQARDRATLLGELHRTGLRLSALEWEAMHQATLQPELKDDIDSALAESAELIGRFASEDATPGLTLLLGDQQRYNQLIRQQVRALVAGRRERAEAIDEAHTDPLFDRIDERLQSITTDLDRQVHGQQQAVNGISLALVLASLLLCGLLMWRNYAILQRRIESQNQLSATRHREEYLARLMENAGELLVVADAHGEIRFLGGAVMRMIAMRQEDLVGRKMEQFCHPEDWSKAQAMFEAARRTPGMPSQGLLRAYGHNGDWRIFDVTVANMQHDPLIAGFILNIRDVTQRVRAEQQLHDLAYRDLLTGLPNRSYLTQSLESRIAALQRDESIALLFVDLDDFKHVNDNYGHEAGDRLLKEIGGRLGDVLSANDVLSRWDGDVFVILAEHGRKPDALGDLAEQLLSRLSKPFDLLGQELVLSATIGISVSRKEVDADAQSALRRADQALHQAKQHCKGSYRFYDAHDSVSAQAPRMKLMTDLHRAIDRGEIEVHYQPIVKLADGGLDRAEALLRWRHYERGIVPNGLFLGIAEDNALIERLGREVFRQTVAGIALWLSRTTLPAEFCVHVNFCPRELRAPGFARMAAETLFEYGVRPERICIEITERSLLDMGAGDHKWASELTAIGLRLCLDDFGTGYSSLSSLHQYPLSGLKVDGSFVERLSNDVSATVVLDAVRSVAEAFSLRLIAEGIETEDQRQRLRALRYVYGQGHLFAPAMPVDEFANRFLIPARSGSFELEGDRPAMQ